MDFLTNPVINSTNIEYSFLIEKTREPEKNSHKEV